MVHHSLAQALAYRIHLGARLTRSLKLQHGAADFESPPDQRDEVNAHSFDVGAHRTWRDGFQTKGVGMLRQLLALDQANLSTTWFTCFAVGPPKVPGFSLDTLGLDYLDFLDGGKRLTWLERMQVKRRNASGGVG